MLWFRVQAVVFVLWNCSNAVTCLYCISYHCRNIDGCPTGDEDIKTVRCPSDASCFLQVKIQSENDMPVITERSQGCATTWDYMKSENGSWTCFDGPNDEHRTCLCSDGNFCNKQLRGVTEYQRLPLEAFPPASTRKIDCIESGVLYSGQSYCTYRRSIGVDHHWLRRAHMVGYVAMLENSQRDHLCFQEAREIDCYCKTDWCNEIVPPPNIMSPTSFIGAYDNKVTCCQGDIDKESQISFADPFQGAEMFRKCSSDAVCTGDYCFIRFKYHTVQRTIVGRQTCYNTSSEVIVNHRFDGTEYGPYRERVLYCRGDFCNELAVATESISAGTRCRGFSLLLLVGHLLWRSFHERD